MLQQFVSPCKQMRCVVSICSSLHCFQKHILSDTARKMSLYDTDGIEEQGSSIMYKANVRRILTEGEGDQLKAVGVQLLDGRSFKGQVHLHRTFAQPCQP